MGFATALLAVFFVYAAAISSTVQSFNCSSSSSSSRVACNGLVGYVSPNSTTLSNITTFFGIKNLRSLLGANNFPLSTPANQTVAANQTIKIPFRCVCTNGTGRPRRPPVYKVVAGDGLYHIAAEVFSGLVTYPQIQAFNNITDANLIEVGQELRIPLPCSCDEVDGERAVHYGHVVEAGSSVEAIARQFNTSEATLLRLNGLASSKDLLAGVVFDVPLKACTSMVDNSSLDYPLLVATGTYAFTAGNCVKCMCDASNNWTLQCEPSQVKSSIWTTCPSMQCQGAENLYLGNSTSSSCNGSTCAYAGYSNQTILTTLAPSESTCPTSDNNNAPKFSLQGQSWSFALIFISSVLLCLHFFQ